MSDVSDIDISARTARGTTRTPRRTTRLLLTGGLLAGPMFVATAGLQALTRDGFDLGHQPISLLSLGDLGWLQVTNFLVAGLLSVGFAIGAGRARSGTWAPRLLALFGLGLVAGGVFRPDPALGFPPGTPDEIPDTMSWHAVLHAVAPPAAFLALVLAAAVLARRFARDGQPAWAWYSVATAGATLLLAAWPDPDGMSVRLAVAVTLGFAWVSLLSARLLRRTA